MQVAGPEKKSIVILGTAWPFRGGLASYNERLALQFQNEGHDVKLLTFTTQYPGFLFPGKTQFSEEPAPVGLNIQRLISSVNPFSWIKTGRAIKRLAPDILIFKFWLPFMGPCFGTVARIVKRNKRTKVIAILDNVIPHEKRTGDKLLTRYFLKAMDGFVSMSKSVENDLMEFDRVKPREFNPHPLFDNFGASISKDEAKKRIGVPVGFNYILFFGIIRDYKGLDLLLSAFARINRSELNVKLLVAGEYYNNKEQYSKQMTDLKIENDVLVVDRFIRDSHVAGYFCAADIVAQPYKHATQSGVSQIAYHFEKPLLVTNVGGLPEMVPDGKVGYVVEKNVDEIAEALTNFYAKNRENEFVNGLKEEKKKYSWDKMTEKLLLLAYSIRQ